MGTTVWLEDATREKLRELQRALGARSVNETIERLMAQPAPDARALFAAHRGAIEAIMRKHGLRKLIAFGSRARGDAKPTSDLDLAAEVAKRASPLAVLAAEADLEAALGIPVSLVELPNPRLAAVLRREGVPFGS